MVNADLAKPTPTRRHQTRAKTKVNYQKTFTLPGLMIRKIQEEAKATSESDSLTAARLLARGMGIPYEDMLRPMEAVGAEK